MIESRMLIDGELVTAKSGEWIDSLNPATEEKIGYFPKANKEDVDAAFLAAESAQIKWAALSSDERARMLRNVATKIRNRADEVLRLEVIDTGNTISKMKADIEHAAYVLEYFAGLATEIKAILYLLVQTIFISPSESLMALWVGLFPSTIQLSLQHMQLLPH